MASFKYNILDKILESKINHCTVNKTFYLRIFSQLYNYNILADTLLYFNIDYLNFF